MNPSFYIPIILLIVLVLLKERNKAVAVKKAICKRRSEKRREMVELAKLFIGKECLIYAFDSNHQFSGIVKEVSDGALLLDVGGSLEAINLDFVIRIREYPRDKKGKKKSVVLD